LSGQAFLIETGANVTFFNLQERTSGALTISDGFRSFGTEKEELIKQEQIWKAHVTTQECGYVIVVKALEPKRLRTTFR